MKKNNVEELNLNPSDFPKLTFKSKLIDKGDELALRFTAGEQILIFKSSRAEQVIVSKGEAGAELELAEVMRLDDVDNPEFYLFNISKGKVVCAGKVLKINKEVKAKAEAKKKKTS